MSCREILARSDLNDKRASITPIKRNSRPFALSALGSPSRKLFPPFPCPWTRLQSRMVPLRPPSTTYNAQKSFSWVNGGLFSPSLSPYSPCPISTLRRAGAGRPPSSRSYSTMYPRSKPSISNPRPERPNTDTSTSDNAPSPVSFLSTCPSTVIPLEIWDCPGNTAPDTLGASLADFSSIIFVIDIQVPLSYLLYGI